jgi:hypothetical protein
MRVGDQPCDNAKNRKRINFHVSGCWPDLLLVQCNKGVVLLIHIQVFNDSFFQEVAEVLETKGKVIDMLLCQHNLAVGAHYQGSHKAATIRCYVDAVLLHVEVD